MKPIWSSIYFFKKKEKMTEYSYNRGGRTVREDGFLIEKSISSTIIDLKTP
jgi:hypothetical protein